jgi:hypothetical protein
MSFNLFIVWKTISLQFAFFQKNCLVQKGGGKRLLYLPPANAPGLAGRFAGEPTTNTGSS